MYVYLVDIFWRLQSDESDEWKGGVHPMSQKESELPVCDQSQLRKMV